MKEKGFTLIELLIVITIIGVLAVAILSAIDPVEQIRKAQDARRRSDSAELLNALERYYTTFEAFPDDTTTSPESPCYSSGGEGCGDVSGYDLWNLVDNKELKSQFTQRTLTDYFVAVEADSAQVCFVPTSKEYNNKWASYDVNGNRFEFQGVGQGTYVCVPE